jgi:hypothetical protein
MNSHVSPVGIPITDFMKASQGVLPTKTTEAGELGCEQELVTIKQITDKVLKRSLAGFMRVNLVKFKTRGATATHN